MTCACFRWTLPAEATAALFHPADQADWRRVNDGFASRPTRSGGVWRKLAFLNGRARASWVLAEIFPCKEYMFWKYSPPQHRLWPTLYAYRWLDLAGDAAASLFDSPRPELRLAPDTDYFPRRDRRADTAIIPAP